MAENHSDANDQPFEPGAATLNTPETQSPPEAENDKETLIAQLRTELNEARDRILRGLADVDNYRKRANRQIEEERRYAVLPFVRDLLPVLDNIRRAIEAGEKNADAASLLEGFKLVGRMLEGMLERNHCTRIESLHKPFDPHMHEAILQQPSKDFPANTVLQEVQGGYKLHDRVVRPSQVIVSSAPAEPQTNVNGQN
ncbi:MAG: nucleotide exchange factor GrpE [Thermoguttaceae bacterium]